MMGAHGGLTGRRACGFTGACHRQCRSGRRIRLFFLEEPMQPKSQLAAPGATAAMEEPTSEITQTVVVAVDVEDEE